MTVVAVTAVATAALFGLRATVGGDEDRTDITPVTPRTGTPTPSHTARALAPAGRTGAGIARTGRPGSDEPESGRPVVAVAAGPVQVRYTFNGGAGRSLADTVGRYPLREVVAVGGDVTLARRDAGWALRFPARCAKEASSCPRSILQGSRADELNPGTRPVRFGASVRMSRADAGDGANVLQKGYSVGGSTQFKLQVDGAAGHPSCVLASATHIYRVVAPVPVIDGAWHAVACVRVGAALSITVDGIARGSVTVPPTLSIRNAEPLRVGGKGTNPGNDQFAGQIDDVFLAIS